MVQFRWSRRQLLQCVGWRWADSIDYSTYMIIELWAVADTVHVTETRRKSWGRKIGLKSALNILNRSSLSGEMMPCGFSHLSGILHFVGLARKFILLPLGPAFRLLSGCQCTKCNWKRSGLSHESSLLFWYLLCVATTFISFRNAKDSRRMSDSLLYFYTVGRFAPQLKLFWRLFARRTRVNKGFMFLWQRLYYGQRWDTVMAQTHLSTVVFFRLFRVSRHGFMCHMATHETQPEQTIKKQKK